jgi:hypothetical protein
MVMEITGKFEALVEAKVAALAFNLPPWKIRRAIQAGLIPHYTLLNRRKLVKLSEVAAAIEASRNGGQP